MRPPPRASRASGTRLFAGYAVASLLPILVLGTVLAGGNRQDGIERGLGQGRAQATERTYWRLGGGLGTLYVVLALISWSTARQPASAGHGRPPRG